MDHSDWDAGKIKAKPCQNNIFPEKHCRTSQQRHPAVNMVEDVKRFLRVGRPGRLLPNFSVILMMSAKCGFCLQGEIAWYLRIAAINGGKAFLPEVQRIMVLQVGTMTVGLEWLSR